ncbi:MAG: alpha/beta hydrolase [Oligoflexia bacterium]|nr:alpha/beta hydrolase [Oligoflexia bacterium]
MPGTNKYNILLLRGLGRTSAHWLDFPEHLKNNLSMVNEVKCIDLPGFGHESDEASPLTIKGITDFVFSKFELLPTSPNWITISVSLGGMVNMHWLSDTERSAHIKGSIIINSSSSDIAHPFERASIKSLSKIIKAGISRDNYVKEKHIASFVNHQCPSEETLKRLAKVNDQFPIKIPSFIKQLLAASHFKSPQYLYRPTLFVRSKNDVMVNPVCSERLASKYNCQLETHPSAGHDLPIEDPAWLVEKVGNFLRSLD